MNTMTRILCLLLLLSAAMSIARADGVMRPTNTSYPGDFLRHRMTDVRVTIVGQIASTVAYQEFVNEWDHTVNAVYSFPLPPEARATALYFWSNDTMFRAVLKAQEQAPNPGTGEGGIDALLNTYLGPNGIRMVIDSIPAGSIQRVQIEYILRCDYASGTVRYRYPFNTMGFAPYPLDLFALSLQVSAADTITAFALNDLPGGTVTQPDARQLKVTAERSKLYAATDWSFSYTAPRSTFGAEFYAINNDTVDGHFVMVVRPPDVAGSTAVHPKHVVFIVDRSSDLFGTTLTEIRAAVSACIRKLNDGDDFTIILFDYGVSRWRTILTRATSTAKDSALQFIAGLTMSYGSALQSALQESFAVFPADTLQKLIVLFSDGKATLNPVQVRAGNSKKISIIPVVAASSAGRQKLEMLAYQNYGFPLLLNPSDLVANRIAEMFDRISAPVLNDVRYEIGSNVYGILPAIAPTLFRGTAGMFTGRFRLPGTGTFSMAGFTPTGTAFYDFSLTFPSYTWGYKFAERFWAKERIDEFERELAVNGTNDSIKAELIKVSLAYGIRCKYTAYIAEKTQPVTSFVANAVTFAAATTEKLSEGVLIRWSVTGREYIAAFRVHRRLETETEFRLIEETGPDVESFLDRLSSAADAQYKIEAVDAAGAVLTTIIVHTGMEIPARTDLIGNYPNPFNPTTAIAYQLSVVSSVSLKVYDLLGREVATLINDVKPAGVYTTIWNASTIPSGVYYCRLTAGKFAETRKMILAR